MNTVYIVKGYRSAIGKSGKGAFRFTRPDDLAANIIKHLVKKGIPVLGHIGLLPQTSGNFKIKGKSFNDKKRIFKDALSISKAGAFAIVIECVDENLAKKITKTIKVPTIGIGASKYCDGQILVTEDM